MQGCASSPCTNSLLKAGSEAAEQSEVQGLGLKESRNKAGGRSQSASLPRTQVDDRLGECATIASSSKQLLFFRTLATNTTLL